MHAELPTESGSRGQEEFHGRTTGPRSTQRSRADWSRDQSEHSSAGVQRRLRGEERDVEMTEFLEGCASVRVLRGTEAQGRQRVGESNAG